ncbi:hypothetical protein BU25DRAFT_44870 [Macroventuria anomochaeta]|uniref:Uncharacterized protein n=1 Tax=Macroventuria anomochaeta TaxID=301207 RepID=A0ACB6S0S4_9PLEO|nr:uncharacterized protein BU25DRAFT_44870 [Macroventuria anomochaeta]KAF2627840.1 hypothetical protein BU25DRAFT_44870 [Macroventuria anomochaeta]
MKTLKNGMLDVTPTGRYLAIVKRNAQKSPLLRLPLEICNKIWMFVLKRDRRHEPENVRPSYCYAVCWHLSIIQVCRQTYAVTALLPFAINSFHVNSRMDRRNLLQLLPGQRDAIQELFDMDYFLDERIEWPIHRFHGLKTLYVEFMVLPVLGEYLGPDGEQAVVNKIGARSEVPDLEVHVRQ